MAKSMSIWNSLFSELKEGNDLILMCVTQSEGSSPGRQGFKMWVSQNDKMEGSIGGGIMEHKLVEWCKVLLKKDPFKPFIKPQVHQEGIQENKSGMICDGHQTIAFFYLQSINIEMVEQIVGALTENKKGRLVASTTALQFSNEITDKNRFKWEVNSLEDWTYEESIGFQDIIYIIGGGHVGLALSEVMNRLGFYVINMDDRAVLNTMEKNIWAHEKLVVGYEDIHQFIHENESPYVALMSFGYRTDHQIIRQLIGKNYAYFGVMGSQVKMDKLFSALIEEGFKQNDLSKINTPIGIKIGSKDPMEIAISVAAEIISVKHGLKTKYT